MTTRSPLLWLGALSLVLAACSSPIKPDALLLPTAAVSPMRPMVVISPTAEAAASAADAETPRSASIFPVSPPSATATSIPVAVDDEEECRKACHKIDINALFGSGAKNQPGTHRAYTTCLECHVTLAKPPLPATHLGRLDAACPACHAIDSSNAK